jgi:uncharacterized membrane protein (UPF0182 family)
VPRELFRDREIQMTPYYVIAQLPQAAQPEFLLMLPLTDCAVGTPRSG